MIINNISDITSKPIVYRIQNFINGIDVHLKLEGLNVSSSIKLKPAIWLIKKLEEEGCLIPGVSTAICSSSGNLGIALSIVCKEKGYPFICVSDPNISSISEQYIHLYGGQLIKVTKKDDNGGYLGSRLNLISKLTNKNANYVFVDQYTNHENVNAHYYSTADEIFQEVPNIDFLFIGAGTTGTLMGCAKFFKRYSKTTKIIAVDAYGSVTFGFNAAKRYIPGLGTSYKPSIADTDFIDDIVLVKEEDTILMCYHLLNKHGLFLGGSSGTVLQGIMQYSDNIPKGATVVTISPDFGDKYLNTIYNKAWLNEIFPDTLSLT